MLLSALFVCVGASALNVIHEASALHWQLLKDKASSYPSVLALGYILGSAWVPVHFTDSPILCVQNLKESKEKYLPLAFW